MIFIFLISVTYSVVWTVRDFRIHRFSTSTAAPWLVIVTFLFAWLPNSATLLIGGQELFNELRGDYDPPPAWAATIATIMFAVLIAGSLIWCLHGISRGRLVKNRLALFALAVILSMAVSSLMRGNNFGSNTIALILVLLACTRLAADPREVRRAAAHCMVFLIGSSAAYGLFNQSAVTQSCRSDKCSAFGDLYHGIWVNSNGMGLALALGMAYLYLATESKLLKASGIIVVVINILATGSRTALIAAGVTVAFMLAGTLKRRSESLSMIQKLGLIASLAVASLPIFYQFTDESFTARGYLWKTAFDLSIGNFWGHGVNGWEELYLFGEGIDRSQRYSAHNEILDVFFRGGYPSLIFAVALMVLSLTRIFRGTSGDRVNLGLTLVPVVSLAFTERPWSFGTLDWLSWTLIAFLLTTASSTDSKTDAADAPHKSKGWSPPHGVSHSLNLERQSRN